MKRWLPFILLIMFALTATIFLITSGQETYTPVSSNPAVIYREACMECHGSGQTEANLWSPALSQEDHTRQGVKEIVSQGTWRMPSFPNITDAALDSLANYVAERRYLEQ